MDELNETIDLINNYQKQLQIVNPSLQPNLNSINESALSAELIKMSVDDRQVEEENQTAMGSDSAHHSVCSDSSQSGSEEILSDSDNEHLEDYDEDGLFKIVSTNISSCSN
jgi:hypothetical protein